MQPVHLRLENGRAIEIERPAHGVAGFISWERLMDALRANGEFKAREHLMSFQIDRGGITYTVQS